MRGKECSQAQMWQSILLGLSAVNDAERKIVRPPLTNKVLTAISPSQRCRSHRLQAMYTSVVRSATTVDCSDCAKELSLEVSSL